MDVTCEPKQTDTGEQMYDSVTFEHVASTAIFPQL